MKNRLLLARGMALVLASAYLCAHAQDAMQAAPVTGLVSIFPDTAELVSGCGIKGKTSVPPGTVIEVQHLCEPTQWRIDPALQAACSGRSVPQLGVVFRGRPAVVPVEAIAFVGQYFHVRLYGELEDAHGDRREVLAVQRMQRCVDNAVEPAVVEFPAGTCREPRQFAAAFDYGTPLNNKILTNGFSVYVRTAGTPTKEFQLDSAADEVLASFGRALTLWMAALRDNDALLTPATRNFIQTRTSTSSGGYRLLLPPQVVRLRCPHTAVFVVELNFGGDETFPSRSLFLTLAKARLVGRTIALNMRDVACFSTMPQQQAGQLSLRDERCVNLLPIAMHELGHAFGIDHIPDASGSALMNPVISDRATLPTPLDVSALVAVLERSVTGARPGELEFREAPGLQAPSDWVIKRD